MLTTAAKLSDRPLHAFTCAYDEGPAFDERVYLARLAEAGVRWLPRSDPDFPALLGAIHDPPAGLFARGGLRRWLERITGAVLIGLGVRLAFERR